MKYHDNLLTIIITKQLCYCPILRSTNIPYLYNGNFASILRTFNVVIIMGIDHDTWPNPAVVKVQLTFLTGNKSEKPSCYYMEHT